MDYFERFSFRILCSSTKNATNEVIINPTPAKANARGPPKMPMKKAITPTVHNSDPIRPTVFDIPVELAMIQK
jgi:hypothetical protein